MDLDLAKLSKDVYDIIWKEPGTTGKVLGTDVEVEEAANGTVHRIVYRHFTFLTQNPNKSSEYAARAREGEQIMWGIIGIDHVQVWKIRMESPNTVFVRDRMGGGWQEVRLDESTQ